MPNGSLARSVKLPTEARSVHCGVTDSAVTTSPSPETATAPEQASEKRTPASPPAIERNVAEGLPVAGLAYSGLSTSGPAGHTGTRVTGSVVPLTVADLHHDVLQPLRRVGRALDPIVGERLLGGGRGLLQPLIQRVIPAQRQRQRGLDCHLAASRDADP